VAAKGRQNGDDKAYMFRIYAINDDDDDDDDKGAPGIP